MSSWLQRIFGRRDNRKRGDSNSDAALMSMDASLHSGGHGGGGGRSKHVGEPDNSSPSSDSGSDGGGSDGGGGD